MRGAWLVAVAGLVGSAGFAFADGRDGGLRGNRDTRRDEGIHQNRGTWQGGGPHGSRGHEPGFVGSFGVVGSGFGASISFSSGGHHPVRSVCDPRPACAPRPVMCPPRPVCVEPIVVRRACVTPIVVEPVCRPRPVCVEPVVVRRCAPVVIEPCRPRVCATPIIVEPTTVVVERTVFRTDQDLMQTSVTPSGTLVRYSSLDLDRMTDAQRAALGVVSGGEFDRAMAASRAGRFDEAVEAYRVHVAVHTDDASAYRMLAVALIEAGRVDEGVAHMAGAYRADPGVARRPIDLSGAGVTGRRFTDLVDAVTQYANKGDSPAAWLTAAAILDSGGRSALATSMLDRAERVGLEREVIREMRGAIQH